MGLIEVALGYETANVEDAPDAHTTVSVFRSSNGQSFHGSFTDASSSTLGKQMVRPVWVVKLTSGSALGMARVAGFMYIVEP